jgi:hypothetical protein
VRPHIRAIIYIYISEKKIRNALEGIFPPTHFRYEQISKKEQELHLLQMQDNTALPDTEAPIKEELHALVE